MKCRNFEETQISSCQWQKFVDCAENGSTSLRTSDSFMARSLNFKLIVLFARF